MILFMECLDEKSLLCLSKLKQTALLVLLAQMSRYDVIQIVSSNSCYAGLVVGSRFEIPPSSPFTEMPFVRVAIEIILQFTISSQHTLNFIFFEGSTYKNMYHYGRRSIVHYNYTSGGLLGHCRETKAVNTALKTPIHVMNTLWAVDLQQLLLI